jgi:hypothetical protein
MTIESATFLSQLVTANPSGGDAKAEGDNHIRLIKTVLQNTFPGLSAAVSFGGWHGKTDALDTKTGNYTAVAGDDGKALFFNLSGAATLTLLAAATAGNGYALFIVKGPSLDLLTIDPASSETVNGQTTITVGPNEGGFLICNGTSWQFIGLSSLFTGERSIKRTENNANAQTGVRLIRERTGSAAANDLGVTIEAQHKDSAGNLDVVGRIGWAMTSITNGAESLAWYIESIVAGAIATADRIWKGQGLYADGLLDPGRGKSNFLDVQRNNVSLFPDNHIFGFQCANNGTDAANDLDIGAGVAADDTNAVMIRTAALTKRLDANWAVGTNQGGLDTGVEANSTWYYVWAIRRPDTGVTDILFSASATSPTMPANYTQKRLVWAFFNDSAGAIEPFVQRGDECIWSDTPAAASGTANTTTTLAALVPAINGVIGHFRGTIDGGGGTREAVWSSLHEADVAPSTTAAPLETMRVNVNISVMAGEFTLMLSNSQTVRVRATASTGVALYTKGWRWHRGREA